MAENEEGKKKRGPKGGIKHTPGRGHDSKSRPSKKKRFIKAAAKLRKEKEEVARRIWKEWDEMPAEQRKLLGPKGEPKVPRPKNEN